MTFEGRITARLLFSLVSVQNKYWFCKLMKLISFLSSSNPKPIGFLIERKIRKTVSRTILGFNLFPWLFLRETWTDTFRCTKQPFNWTLCNQKLWNVCFHPSKFFYYIYIYTIRGFNSTFFWWLFFHGQHLINNIRQVIWRSEKIGRKKGETDIKKWETLKKMLRKLWSYTFAFSRFN